jgi:hypothetical protein
MNDHGYVLFVVLMFEPSILCGNAWTWICSVCRINVWTKYSVWNISMIIHYLTEYLVQTWLGQTKHIHDHSLPDRILGSTMTTTNGTYPWSFITTQNTWFNYVNQVFCVVMNDHGYVSFVVVMFEPSILCGNEWSWICFVCRSHSWTKYSVWWWMIQIHDHSLPHRILGSTMTTTNEAYPWSFITTQNTSFNHDYDKWNKSMIIHYHTDYLVQPICFVCCSHGWTKYSVW